MTPPERSVAPIELGPRHKVGIVAGSGRLPINIADSLQASGHPPLVIMIEGEADPKSSLARHEHQGLALEDFSALPGIFKRHGITHVVLAGAISRRPSLRSVRLRFALLPMLTRAVAGLARGDDGLLSALVAGLERYGVKVVGAHEIVPDLLAVAGPMTRTKPRKGDVRDLDAAFAAARAIGALDIGQAAVSIGGRVIALEGIEGTDGLLARVADLRGHGRLAGRTRGVLVKCLKPGQEVRADLPSIGPSTVEGAHAAGLAGIGVEAGRSLVLDFAKMAERADALGLFVVGMPSGDGT